MSYSEKTVLKMYKDEIIWNCFTTDGIIMSLWSALAVTSDMTSSAITLVTFN